MLYNFVKYVVFCRTSSLTKEQIEFCENQLHDQLNTNNKIDVPNTFGSVLFCSIFMLFALKEAKQYFHDKSERDKIKQEKKKEKEEQKITHSKSTKYKKKSPAKTKQKSSGNTGKTPVPNPTQTKQKSGSNPPKTSKPTSLSSKEKNPQNKGKHDSKPVSVVLNEDNPKISPLKKSIQSDSSSYTSSEDESQSDSKEQNIKNKTSQKKKKIKTPSSPSGEQPLETTQQIIDDARQSMRNMLANKREEGYDEFDIQQYIKKLNASNLFDEISEQREQSELNYYRLNVSDDVHIYIIYECDDNNSLVIRFKSLKNHIKIMKQEGGCTEAIVIFLLYSIKSIFHEKYYFIQFSYTNECADNKKAIKELLSINSLYLKEGDTEDNNILLWAIIKNYKFIARYTELEKTECFEEANEITNRFRIIPLESQDKIYGDDSNARKCIFATFFPLEKK